MTIMTMAHSTTQHSHGMAAIPKMCGLSPKLNIATFFRCKTTEICKLKSDVGPCRAIIPKWYFDYSTSQCIQFNFGGCQGNGNNFFTKEECNDFCKSNSGKRQGSSPEEVCALPSTTGPCRAMMPRYFFNSATRKCERFNYGGCAGNANNFETEDSCKSFCGPRAIV